MKRPLPYILLFMCIGIYYGTYLSDGINDIYKIIAAAALVITAAAVCQFNTKRKFASLLPLAAIMGIFLFKSTVGSKPDINLLNDIAADRKSVEISGVIVDSSKSGDRNIYKVVTQSIITENNAAITDKYGIRIFTDKKYDIGSKIKLKTRLYAHSGKMNPSDFDNRLYLRIHGCDYSMYCGEEAFPEVIGRSKMPFYTLKNIMYSLRDRTGEVFDRYFTAKQAGILKAITTGEKSALENDVKESFKGAGIYHFLAISGLHLSVLAAFMVFVLKKVSKRAAYVVTMLFLALYWVLTGGSVSVTRAVLMIYVYLLGKLIYRQSDLINSASAAAILLLIHNPLYLFDTGFLYSFSSVFGIGLALLPLSKFNKKGAKMLRTVAASFGATLFTRIITLVSYYTLNIYDIIINLLLIPFMSFIVVYAMGFGLIGLTGLKIGAAAVPLGLALDALTYTADKLSKFAVIVAGCPTRETFLIILAAVLAVMLFLLRPSAKRAVFALILVSLTAVVSNMQKSDVTRVNFLYVGQGNCCVITKGKSACIVDCCGSELSAIGADNGTYKVMPFLNYSGVDNIDSVFISHTDTDHIKGLFDLMGNIKIKNIYISAYTDKNENYNRLTVLSKANGIPVNELYAGDTVKNGFGDFCCVYPFELSRENNKNSMVIKAQLDGFSVLFTGDIDKKCERAVVESGADIKADVLELPHHGSSTSTSVKLVKAVKPEFAVASSGINNRYGHPSKKTADRMRKYNIPLYKTNDGLICFMAKDDNLGVYRYENLEYNSIVRSLR